MGFIRRSSRRRSLIPHGIGAAILLGLFAIPSVASADLVKLTNGGELRGKVVPLPESKQRIQLETITGASVVIDRSEIVFITKRSQSVEEYETRSRRVDETWEAQWELAEWCRQKSLTPQREVHLRRVIELSPEHEKAQMALGRVWNKGQWIDRDELMTSQGYVKYKNRYITPQELEVIENTAEDLERERSWFSKIRLWLGWLDDPNETRAKKGLTSLQEIVDPHAAPAIIKFMSTDTRIPIRELAVTILIKISGPKSISGLVNISLFDVAQEIREAALKGIGRDHYERVQAEYVKGLKSESNAIVCRAAAALGQIGDQRSIGPLIEALITSHAYQSSIDQPNGSVYCITADGNFATNTQQLPRELLDSMRSGHLLPPTYVQSDGSPLPKKTVTVHVNQHNAEALAALGKITHQDFGYDKRTWKLWWAAEKDVGGKTFKFAK